MCQSETEAGREAEVCGSGRSRSFGMHTMSAKELKALQEVDPSLEAIREGAEHGKTVNGVSFVVNHEGMLHRVVEPGAGEVIAREQLVLPLECRHMVMELAHSVPRLPTDCYSGFTGQPCGRMWQTTVGGVRYARRHPRLNPAELR